MSVIDFINWILRIVGIEAQWAYINMFTQFINIFHWFEKPCG